MSGRTERNPKPEGRGGLPKGSVERRSVERGVSGKRLANCALRERETQAPEQEDASGLPSYNMARSLPLRNGFSG
jgi:hypothetical protein